MEKGAQNSINPKSKVTSKASSQAPDQEGLQRRDGNGQVNAAKVCSWKRGSNFSSRLKHFSNRGLNVSYSYIALLFLEQSNPSLLPSEDGENEALRY